MGGGLQLHNRSSFQEQLSEEKLMEQKEALQAKVERMLGTKPNSQEDPWWTDWENNTRSVIQSLARAIQDDVATLDNAVSAEDKEAKDEQNQRYEDMNFAKLELEKLEEALGEDGGLLTSALDDTVEQFQTDLRSLQDEVDSVWGGIEAIQDDNDAREANEALSNLEKSPGWQQLIEAARRNDGEALVSVLGSRIDEVVAAMPNFEENKDLPELNTPGVIGALEECKQPPEHPSKDYQDELQRAVEEAQASSPELSDQRSRA